MNPYHMALPALVLIATLVTGLRRVRRKQLKQTLVKGATRE